MRLELDFFFFQKETNLSTTRLILICYTLSARALHLVSSFIQTIDSIKPWKLSRFKTKSALSPDLGVWCLTSRRWNVNHRYFHNNPLEFTYFLKSFTKFLTTSQENLEEATSKVARSQNSSPRGNMKMPRVSMSPRMSPKRLLSRSSSCENLPFKEKCASCHEPIDESCYICLSCSNQNPRICQHCFKYHQKLQALANHEVYISVLLNSWE